MPDAAEEDLFQCKGVNQTVTTMRPADELYIAQTADADAAGMLAPAQRAELEARMASDPAFAQAYREYFHTISSLVDGGNRSRYKAMLQDIHQEVTTPKKSFAQRLIAFRPQYLRTAAMAATVALLTSAITVFTIRQNEPKSVSTTLELVKHDVARIKRAQKDQEGKIQEIKEVVDATNPQVQQLPQSNYSATGFALSNDGYLITNYHVVEGAENLQIQTRNGELHTASIIAFEPKNDIALLKVNDPAFRFGKGDLPYSFMPGKAGLGAPVYTLGFPQDEIVYNEGYIASRNGNEGDSNQYRLEVPAGPGQSGAPVLDASGNIIGIIRSKDAQTESTTYAVTSKTLLRLIKDVPKENRPRLTSGNRMSGLSRQQQIEKLQDYTCMVRVYKK
jgi:S1-C subfamily serine protease